MHSTTSQSPSDTGRTCVADVRCRDYDHPAGHAAYVGACPFCDVCLRHHEQAVRALVYDYVDLEQMLPKPLSEWSDGQPAGGGEPPAPLRTNVEALQREIHYVTTLWAGEVRARARLSEPGGGMRDGAAVQAAVTVLAPRLGLLARVGSTAVHLTGADDEEPTAVAGWEAVQQLAELHQRARAMLGRTRRRFWIPGDCPNPGCGKVGTLWRNEPSVEGDEPPVNCDHCGAWRPYEEYQRYVAMLVWPQRHPELVGASA